MRRTSPCLLVALTALAWALPAQAGLKLCNNSGQQVRAAMGHFDGTDWTSHGWWTIAPKACADLISGSLQARFYYFYASDGAGGTWEGKTHFCVAPDRRFRSVGRAGCAKRGFDRRGFFEVDTGKKPDWTQSLSD